MLALVCGDGSGGAGAGAAAAAAAAGGAAAGGAGAGGGGGDSDACQVIIFELYDLYSVPFFAFFRGSGHVQGKHAKSDHATYDSYPGPRDSALPLFNTNDVRV